MKLLHNLLSLRLRPCPQFLQRLLPSDLLIDADGDEGGRDSKTGVPITVAGDAKTLSRLANLLAEFELFDEVSLGGLFSLFS